MEETPHMDQLMKDAAAWCDTFGRGGRSVLARKLNVERQVITNWLSGAKAPGGEYALALRQFLDTTPPQRPPESR